MARRESTRREFLSGRAAADALADLAAGKTPSGGGTLDLVNVPYLVQLGRRAMACQFEVFLNAGQYPQGAEAALAALDLVDALEAQLTVYRDSSELMHVNRHAADEPVPVEQGLFQLLAQSLELHAETGGAFDITSGPLSKAWGFYRRQGSIPDEASLAEALEKVGSQYVQLDAAQQAVRFTRGGVELNLGSIGKGYALDRCAQQMEQAGVCDFLWHGGQSSVLARGSAARPRGKEQAAWREGWVIGVRDPLRPQRRLAEITVRNAAVGTSGSGVQFFRHQGRRYGHILDPRTGWPAEGVFSSTVIAPTAALADALATAFYVMGAEAALEHCRRHDELAMLMLLPSASGSSIELVAHGLDDDQWRLLERL